MVKKNIIDLARVFVTGKGTHLCYQVLRRSSSSVTFHFSRRIFNDCKSVTKEEKPLRLISIIHFHKPCLPQNPQLDTPNTKWIKHLIKGKGEPTVVQTSWAIPIPVGSDFGVQGISVSNYPTMSDATDTIPCEMLCRTTCTPSSTPFGDS